MRGDNQYRTSFATPIITGGSDFRFAGTRGTLQSDSTMADPGELAGKVALVTGGARNIGRAIARALAAGGAAVMVNARSSREEAEATAGMIRSAGGRAALHFADVTDPGAVAARRRRSAPVDSICCQRGDPREIPFAETR
jgi:3-oxoacyl-[acyl-carrier protein] reductase